MVGCGVDLYAGKQHRQFEVLDVRRLAHNVLPRKVVAALLQHLNERRGGAERINRVSVNEVDRRQVFRYKSGPLLVAGIVFPALVGRVLGEKSRD
jgi:hypothetical protein